MRLRPLVIVAAIATVIGLGILGAQLGVVATAIGAMVFGIGGVGLLSAAFYAIGRSEDRERSSREDPPTGR
jgi:hypothetical protein